jgi:hypothetical protein
MNEIIAYLHVTGRRYAVSIDGQKIVEDSRDPECDAARVLLARNITGMVKLLDANTGAHRSTLNIEKAAKLRTYDDSRGLGFERWKPFQPLEVRGRAVEEEGEGGEIAA